MWKVKGYVWAGIEISLRYGVVKASVIHIEKANIYIGKYTGICKDFY